MFSLLKNNRKYLLIFVLLIILLFSVGYAISFGSTQLTISDVYGVILNKVYSVIKNDESLIDLTPTFQIVWNIRLPRVVFGLLCGIGLSVAGCIIQSLVHNPIADPYILGISSGASAGDAVSLLLPIQFFYTQYQTTFFAFGGALLSSFLVYSITMKSNTGKLAPTTLILSGIAINAVMSALTNLLIFLSKSQEGIAVIYNWQMGSLAAAQWNSIPLPFVCIFVGVVICLKLSKQLNIIMMGDEDAVALGVNVNKIKIILFITCAFMTAALVSVTGIIGFVGLVIPHVSRILLSTSDNRYIIPISALIGSIYLIWADVIARSAFGFAELPIGILTAIIGAPFFMYLLTIQNKRKEEE